MIRFVSKPRGHYWTNCKLIPSCSHHPQDSNSVSSLDTRWAWFLPKRISNWSTRSLPVDSADVDYLSWWHVIVWRNIYPPQWSSSNKDISVLDLTLSAIRHFSSPGSSRSLHSELSLCAWSCRNTEDFISWTDNSAIRRQLLDYQDMVRECLWTRIRSLTVVVFVF